MTGPSGTAIAVVGMACRLPGAGDTGSYWERLRSGTEALTRFGRDELLAAGADPADIDRPGFVPAKGVLPGSGSFDWSYFGYSRAEAAGIDPQQRVFLECAATAIDDAAIDPTRFPGRIAVFAGADRVGARAGAGLSELATYIGREKDFLATRVAYKLGLRGPAVTVQTACSTSLTAVHLAARSLAGRECDAALAGGVTLTPGEWGYLYEPGGILSPDGHCRPFDERAAGTVPSEGVGVVVLKRMADALRDGDRIAAVLLGSAINNDGSDKMGYTAPSVAGQSEVIRYAQQVAGVDPADIDYVEAHATATPIGDPVEVLALSDVFGGSSDATGWCRLGGVKGNIGHTGAAAGVASFIKTVLMLEHGTLVPTVHFGRPNPLLELEATPFTVTTAAQPWPDRGTRLAAVSSFGVGGTNAHAILSGAPEPARATRSSGARVLALSAASAEALDRMRGSLAERLASRPAPGLPEVARTLADRRALGHRRAFVAAQPAEAAHLLRVAAPPVAPGRLDRVAFVLPGQGVLRHAAGAAAYRLLDGFRARFDEIRDAVAGRFAVDLGPVVGRGDADPDWYADTVHQQLGLFALGYALGRQLRDWGVQPSAMLGNSVGEYTAATLAGVWDPVDAAALVHQRARAMWATAPGRMVAVNAPPAEIDRLLDGREDVTVSVVAPGGVVLSGTPGAVAALPLDGLDARPLHALRAFHSPAMAPAARALRAAVAATPSRPARLRLVSNETGDWADPEAVRGPDYWAGQLRRPVLLAEGMARLLGSGCDTYLELGPGASMLAGLRRHPDWDAGHLTVPLLGGAAQDAERALLHAIGALWERGVDGALADTLGSPRPPRCSLPGYPFATGDPEDAAPSATAPVVQSGQSTSDGGVRTVLERLWYQALGAAPAGDADDFFALGGESLMAVNLLSQVRERTGLALSVTEFSRAGTFGALVALAERAQAAAQRPGMVALRAAARGRPVFLVADATGTALGYGSLADRLDLDRPVYGLEQVDRARGGIGAIAAGHVETVLRAQPDGPYTLGGWSFGAIVAHELAAQLAGQGATVDVVACLDGYPHPTGTGGLRLQAAALLRTGPVGRQLRHAPELRRLFVANIGATRRYRPPAVPARAVVFLAAGRPRAADRLRGRLRPLYGGGVRVRRAAGDHWSMLAPPHVDELARDLATELSDPATDPGSAQRRENEDCHDRD